MESWIRYSKNWNTLSTPSIIKQYHFWIVMNMKKIIYVNEVIWFSFLSISCLAHKPKSNFIMLVRFLILGFLVDYWCLAHKLSRFKTLRNSIGFFGELLMLCVFSMYHYIIMSKYQFNSLVNLILVDICTVYKVLLLNLLILVCGWVGHHKLPFHDLNNIGALVKSRSMIRFKH